MIIEATSTSLILYTSRHIFGYLSHGGSATSARKCLHEGERKKGSCKLNRNVLVNLRVQGCIVGVACQFALWRNEQWLSLLLCGESLIYLPGLRCSLICSLRFSCLHYSSFMNKEDSGIEEKRREHALGTCKGRYIRRIGSILPQSLSKEHENK